MQTERTNLELAFNHILNTIEVLRTRTIAGRMEQDMLESMIQRITEVQGKCTNLKNTVAARIPFRAANRQPESQQQYAAHRSREPTHPRPQVGPQQFGRPHDGYYSQPRESPIAQLIREKTNLRERENKRQGSAAGASTQKATPAPPKAPQPPAAPNAPQPPVKYKKEEFGRNLPTIFNDKHEGTRIKVLIDTLKAFETKGAEFKRHAEQNLATWKKNMVSNELLFQVQIVQGDWGDVALNMTKTFGTTFAVLNMANALTPGGGYTEGLIAQEENMFRRTDCHFSIKPSSLSPDRNTYLEETTKQLNALTPADDPRVYIDIDHPRVCVRGRENQDAEDLGYTFLPDNEIFPFYELRAAACDLRKVPDVAKPPFKRSDARRRICAILNTLHANKIKHVVLGALGCGAFENPTTDVAQIFHEEIQKMKSQFTVITFAIFNAGYGKSDNFEKFQDIFKTQILHEVS